MSEFRLSISSKDLIGLGEREPFGFLFISGESLNTRDEHGVVKTKCKVIVQ